jgi:malate dehydrogenase
MAKAKISLIGGGNIGGVLTLIAAQKELGDIVLYDIVEGMPQGKALDISHLTPLVDSDTRILGTNNYADTANSDLCIVTAGFPRKPGMSRDDLVKTNADIVKSVSQEIKKVAPKSIIIMVSNPLDVMAWVAKEVTGFPRERVMGMAGILDTARFRAFLSEAIGISVEDIQAMVLGGHGDSMVPLISYTTVSGIPVSQLIDKAKLDAIVQRTRKGGGEIVSHLKTGSAYYAPSAGAVQMVEAIVKDKKRLLPCAAWLEGEFGLSGLFVGVPCKLGAGGMEKIVEIELTAEEQAALEKSAEAVKSTWGVVKL